MADGNFLLRFIADMSQVERELAALDAKGKAAGAKAAAGAAPSAAARPLRVAGVDIGNLSATDAASAGRARGSLRSLVNYLDSVGQLGNVVGGKAQLLKNIDASRLGVLGAQDPAAYAAASRAAQGSTTRALRAAGPATPEEAAAVATRQLIAATETKAAATTQSTAKGKADATAESAASKKKTAATNAAAEAEAQRAAEARIEAKRQKVIKQAAEAQMLADLKTNQRESLKNRPVYGPPIPGSTPLRPTYGPPIPPKPPRQGPVYGPPAPPASQNAVLIAQNQAAKAAAQLAAALQLQVNPAHQGVVAQQAILAQQQAAARAVQQQQNALAKSNAAAQWKIANAGQIAAAQQQNAIAKQRITIARLGLASEEAALREKAQEVVRQEQYNRLLARAIQSEARQQGMKYRLGGGMGGGHGQFAEKGLGGFGFAGGLRSTIRYGLPAALLYGTISGVSTLIREATELELELGLLEDQWAAMTDAAGEVNGVSFEDLRGQILDISEASLTSADQVASTVRQLAGAFGDEIQNPLSGFDLQAEAQTALQFSKVTGLPVQEITDSLTAIRLAFEEDDVTIQNFADTTTYLEKQFGVLSREIATFVADIAPLGAELGFTYEQLAGVAAVAQQASGRSGAVLSEQLGRILPALKDRQADVISILTDAGVASEKVDRIAAAFAQNRIPDVIQGLADSYGELDSGSRNTLGALVGTRREAATLFALLSRNEKLSEVLGGNFDAEGAFDERWTRYRQTVSATFEALGRSVEKFGLALFDAGLGDALIQLGELLGTIADVMVIVTEGFSDFNQLLGGVPGEVLKVVAVVALLAKGFLALRDAQLAQAAAGFLGGKGRGAAAITNPLLAQVGAGAYGGGVQGGAPIPPAGRPMGLLGRLGASAASNTIIPGISGTAGAIFGTVAVAGAAYAVNEAVNQYKGFRDDVQSAAEEFDAKVREAYESGKSEEEILRIAREADRTEGTRSRIGRFISGEAGFSERVVREINEVQADENVAILEEILRTQADSEGNITLDNGQVYSTEEYEQMIAYFKANPGKKNLNEAVDALIAQYPKIAEATRASIEEKEANDKAAAAAERRIANAGNAFLQHQLTVDEATVEYEAGRMNTQRYVEILDANIAKLEHAIEVQRENGRVDAQLLADLEERTARRNAALEKATATPLRAAQLLTSLTGGTDIDNADQNIAIAQAALRYASTSDEKYDAAVGVLEAQEAAFQAYVNAGETAAEKLARAQEGFDLDPDALRVVVGVALQANSDVIRIGNEIGMSIEELTDLMVTAIDAQGRVDRDIIAGIIRHSATLRIHALKMAGSTADALQNEKFGRFHDVSDEIALINAQTEQQIADLYSAVTGATPSGGTAPSDQTADLRRQAAEEAEAAAKEARDKARALEEARLDYLLALVENDPVAAARNAQAQADIAIRYAEDAAARIAGEAARVRADRSLQEAMEEIGRSRVDLLIATAEAQGDSVESARLSVQRAKEELWRTVAGGHGEAAINAAQAELIGAEAGYRDAQLEDKKATYEFMHDMGEISTQQLITYLQSLLQIPDLTEEQTRDIQRQIKGLQDDLGSNYQFNLPSDLALPTLYEVRRGTQSAGGMSGYQDNSTVQINFTAYNTEDANVIADRIVTQFSKPTRFGTAGRAF